MKVKLIKDWKKCHKLFSVQLASIGATLSTAYVSMYDKLKDNLPPKYMVALTVAVFIATMLARLVSQQKDEQS